jgi:primosomal protein N' (replication factor Y)
LNKKNIFPVILQKLVDKNILVLHEEVQENYKPKLVRYVRLHPKFDSNQGLNELLETLNAAKQRDVVMSYFQIVQPKRSITVKKKIN